MNCWITSIQSIVTSSSTPPQQTHLDSSDSKFDEGSKHLSARPLVVLIVSYDFDEQRVVIRGDDGARKCRGTIQTDSHALPTPEHLENWKTNHVHTHITTYYIIIIILYTMVPTITWVPSGFSGYIWPDTKIVFKKMKNLILDFLFFKSFGWACTDWDGLGIMSEDDWLSAEIWRWLEWCMSRKTWGECVNDDIKLLGVQPEWAVFRDTWRDFILGHTSKLCWAWKKLMFSNKLWWWRRWLKKQVEFAVIKIKEMAGNKCSEIWIIYFVESLGIINIILLCC